MKIDRLKTGIIEIIEDAGLDAGDGAPATLIATLKMIIEELNAEVKLMKATLDKHEKLQGAHTQVTSAVEVRANLADKRAKEMIKQCCEQSVRIQVCLH